MKIISHRKRHETERYDVFYESVSDSSNSGFAFECDPEGRVLLDKLGRVGRDSYDFVTGPGAALYAPPRIERHVRSYVEPAVGRCDCGARVELSGFTNECPECSADYNSAGQRLAPREQWGEETGESLADILGIDGTSTEDLLDGR